MVEEQIPSHGGNAHLAGSGIGRGVVGGEAVQKKQVSAFDGIQRLIHFAGHLRVPRSHMIVHTDDIGEIQNVFDHHPMDPVLTIIHENGAWTRVDG